MEFNQLELEDNSLEFKICGRCKLNKPISDYYLNRYKYPLTNCKDCSNILTKEWLTNHPEFKKEQIKRRQNKINNNLEYREKVNESKRRYVNKNPELILYNMTKSRAKISNIPFNLSLEDIIIPEFCPLLNIKLQKGKGAICNTSPTLDKINPKLGYIKGNVRVISKLANAIKNNATKEELLTFCKNIISYLNV